MSTIDTEGVKRKSAEILFLQALESYINIREEESLYFHRILEDIKSVLIQNENGTAVDLYAFEVIKDIMKFYRILY